MNNYDFFNMLQQQHQDLNKDKAYEDFFKTLFRKKSTIIIAVIVSLFAVLMYNNYTTPYYESSVLLKKENPENKALGDELSDIFSTHKQELLETEMKVVKTSAVLKNAINQLNLNLTIDKIISPKGKETEINKAFPEYNNEYFGNKNGADNYPQFLDIKISDENFSGNLVIKKISKYSSAIYDAFTGNILSTVADTNAIIFTLPKIELVINWPSAQVGSKIYFSVESRKALAVKLMNGVTVEQIENTDIFQIFVRTTSPYLAKEIANTLAKVYQETRIEQQKETIRYSFNFIDQQLQEISQKLKNAENNLSEFKSKNQIITIGEKSGSLIEYLSTLEAEKIKTNIELSEFTIKKDEIEKEYGQQGIFDQTYLTPDKSASTISPFAVLQEQNSNLEIQRIELLKKHTKNHPDVINIDNQIEQVRKQMASYNQNTLSAYKVLINSAIKKQGELDKLSKSYRDMIGNIPPQENKLSELLRERAVFEKVFTLLLNKREEMRIAELSKLQDLIVIEPAASSDNIVSPNKKLNIILSIFLGLFIGVIIVWSTERFNTKLTDLNDIEEKFKLPILGIIPNFTHTAIRRINKAADYNERFVVFMSNLDKFKESFNYLKIKINYTLKTNPKILMLTSCEEHTGKTSILAHLSIFLAKQNKKVLIIDADFKRARLSEIFDLPPGNPGFYNYLSNGDTVPATYNLMKVKEKDKVYKTLDIIPIGEITKNSSSLLESEKMKQFISLMLNSSYDYILFDTPPALNVVDALVIGSLIKNTILVVRPDRSYMDSISWGLKEMELHGLKIWGTVVNACDIGRSAFRHKYGYGYEYAYSIANLQNDNGSKIIKPKELPRQI